MANGNSLWALNIANWSKYLWWSKYKMNVLAFWPFCRIFSSNMCPMQTTDLSSRFFFIRKWGETKKYKRKSNANHESTRIPKNPIKTKTNEHGVIKSSSNTIVSLWPFKFVDTYHGYPGKSPSSNGKCNMFILKSLIRKIHFNRMSSIVRTAELNNNTELIVIID